VWFRRWRGCPCTTWYQTTNQIRAFQHILLYISPFSDISCGSRPFDRRYRGSSETPPKVWTWMIKLLEHLDTYKRLTPANALPAWSIWVMRRHYLQLCLLEGIKEIHTNWTGYDDASSQLCSYPINFVPENPLLFMSVRSTLPICAWMETEIVHVG
jgi:hypothetical protein